MAVSCNTTLVIASHRIFQGDLNEHGTVFGGRILALVDDSASIAAVRLAHSVTVTASLDHVNFIAPLHLNDAMELMAYVSGSGHRSLEVFAKVLGEDRTSGHRFLAFTCFITFVTTQQPAPVLPAIVPETAEQRYICAGYEQRVKQRQQQRANEADLLTHLSLVDPWNTN